MADCSCSNFPASLGNVTFGAAFEASGKGITQILLNSSGANWGRVQNDAANTWSMGYGSANSTALGAAVLSWNSSGQVGIGTTTPAAGSLLHITGGGGVNAAIRIASNNNSTIAILQVVDGSPGGLQIQNGAGTPILSFDDAGQRVGIGTTAPSDTLEVDGNIRIGGNSGYFINMGTGGAQILLDSAGANWGKIQNDTANTWSLAYDTSRSSGLGTPVLSWNSSGYIGMGKTNPAHPLDVNGTVSCNGLLVGTINIGAQIYDSTGTYKLVDGNGCYYG